MAKARENLWHHADFMKLWIGQSISEIGSQITLIALPLTAVLVLDARPAQMGLLNAMETLPFVMFGLIAGVWVDRMRRLPILIMADVARAILLAIIPVAALLGALQIEHLYAVGFLVGVCSVLFDIAHQSYLPAVVERPQLIDGNSKLELSRSIAQLVGPGLGGALVKAVSAPVAIGVDAVSFLVSALVLGAIRRHEPRPKQAMQSQNMWIAVRQGLVIVTRNPLLRAAAGCSATANLFTSMGLAIFILFAMHDLGIAPVWLGAILGASGGGALLAAIVVQPITSWLGIGRTLIWTLLVMGASTIVIPLTHGSGIVSVVMLTAAQFFVALGSVAFNINSRSLRQAIAPEHLLGRVNASVRFIVWSTLPLGGLLGGLLAEVIGMRATLVVASLGVFLAPLWIALSPVVEFEDMWSTNS